MHADPERLIARFDQKLVGSQLHDAGTVLFDLDVAVPVTQVEIVRAPGPERVAILEVVGHAHAYLAGKKVSGEPWSGPDREPAAFLVDRELSGPWRREIGRGLRSPPGLPLGSCAPAAGAGRILEPEELQELVRQIPFDSDRKKLMQPGRRGPDQVEGKRRVLPALFQPSGDRPGVVRRWLGVSEELGNRPGVGQESTVDAIRAQQRLPVAR